MTATNTFEYRGMRFESPYSHIDAGRRLWQLREEGTVQGTGFVNDMLDRFQRYRGRTRVSEKQGNLLHWIVFAAEHPDQARALQAEAVKVDTLTGFQPIYDHLLSCVRRREDGGKGLSRPQVWLEQEPTLFLRWQTRGKHPNSIAVAQHKSYGVGLFYGWIKGDEFITKNRPDDERLEVLRVIARNPAFEILRLGRESGHCLYCGAELKQVQAKIAGAGKTCSENWGVHWPSVPEARAFCEEHPELDWAI